MRQLNPHSLSYQLTTFAQWAPSSSVSGASTIDEWGLLLKSDDTSSSWLTARMPLSAPLEASSNAALMALALAEFFSSTVRSTRETSSIGTRNALPAHLPAWHSGG